MAAMRGPRLQVGSAAWVAEERTCALQIAKSEVEEFSFSARNELDWLNEHMAGIFDENETNIAETFKTPGKLRGKTPRTARRAPNATESRTPLSDIFAATPNGSTNRFAQKLNRLNSPKSQFNIARSPSSPPKGGTRKQNILSPKAAAPGGATQDSGYCGSQDVYSQGIHIDDEAFDTQQTNELSEPAATRASLGRVDNHTAADEPPKKVDQIKHAPQRQSEASQHIHAGADLDTKDEDMSDATGPEDEHPSPEHTVNQDAAPSDPVQGGKSPTRSSEDHSDDGQSNSDGSSPIRPLVRKSSLNFASLPAREPLTSGKSLGAHASRTSYFDPNRKSHYNPPTGGKSLSNNIHHDSDNEEDEDGRDEVRVGQQQAAQLSEVNPALNHNKTYTQRLQDQIDLLGKSQPSGSRPSKSTHNLASLQQTTASGQPSEAPKSPISKPLEVTTTTPGAFPDDDDWIDPPAPAQASEDRQSPRLSLPKSHSTDVMEGIHKSDHVSHADFVASTEEHEGHSASPQRARTPYGLSGTPGHAKTASVPAIPAISQSMRDQTLPLAKAISASNSMPETEDPHTPSQSPSRAFRDSPLKQVKNKLSSILKSSRGLLASSAVVSAEGKTSVLSPSGRIAFHAAPSSESVVSKASAGAHVADERDNKTMPVARRTRASAEREKEEKEREKETKLQEQQMSKLEKAREKEREKARVFSKEQERIASLEQRMASKREEDQPPVKSTPKTTRSSPRKAQRPPETVAKPVDHDVEMTDALPTAPPSVYRPANSSQASRAKETKRPVKPTRETQAKAKQAPTVIRVNTGSQHSQYHSAANTSAVNAPEPVAAPASQPQQQPPTKASKATLQSKPSTQSLKGASSTSRSKVLDSATKKREQEEREAQRRREAKAEMERKRAASQEEQRKQEQRRQEAERQKQRDREQAAAHAAQTEAKHNAQRQAMIEKAKQTKAPPPAARLQPNGPPEYGSSVREAQPSRPATRMDAGLSRNDEPSRPASAKLPTASKAGLKRTLGPEANDDAKGKRPQSRGGPSYQTKDTKRRRTSEERDDVDAGEPPNIKGPPVRPSAGFKKELPKKSLFQNGYANAPPSATRDLFKATLTSQHNSQNKSTHPLDMAQISKGTIPFAPNPNAPATSYKTPARPVVANGSKSTAKSAQRSSPRFQNGESIELPEIETDDEDDEDDGGRGMVAPWAESPELRMALMRQETLDPEHIFGPPQPLNMEEVFNKNKDRWHKFRARTSSANWSGFDRLTEDDIRKDLAARDKLRREGGWSYELGNDLV